MQEHFISSIVINWNLPQETERCLESLTRSTIPCHIILVDNGSQDGSIEYLQNRFPSIIIISLPTNVGFGRACNLAIQRALEEWDDEYIFLLNNDAFIHHQALKRLVDMAIANPQAGIFGPKVYYRHLSSAIWYAGARRRWGVLAATDTGRDQIDQGQFDQVSMVDYVFGAAMFIRRSVIERIGFFDERYFLYLEDLDYCLRAQQAGFSLMFVPQAKIWHVGSASTSQNLELRRYHQVRSTILFLKKHASLLSLFPALLFWCAVLIRMILVDIIRGDADMVRSYLSAVSKGITEIRLFSWKRVD